MCFLRPCPVRSPSQHTSGTRNSKRFLQRIRTLPTGTDYSSGYVSPPNVSDQRITVNDSSSATVYVPTTTPPPRWFQKASVSRSFWSTRSGFRQDTVNAAGFGYPKLESKSPATNTIASADDTTDADALATAIRKSARR
jgi:hypothetical protein